MQLPGTMGPFVFANLGVALNRAEFSVGEVLVPWVLIIGALGFLAAWLVVAIMEYTGLARHVWHLPLFFVGLVVLFSSLIGLAVSP
jgi:phosphoglycerol transferase MdoB-like AlkP superfamily enzyme